MFVIHVILTSLNGGNEWLLRFSANVRKNKFLYYQWHFLPDQFSIIQKNLSARRKVYIGEYLYRKMCVGLCGVCTFSCNFHFICHSSRARLLTDNWLRSHHIKSINSLIPRFWNVHASKRKSFRMKMGCVLVVLNDLSHKEIHLIDEFFFCFASGDNCWFPLNSLQNLSTPF